MSIDTSEMSRLRVIEEHMESTYSSAFRRPSYRVDCLVMETCYYIGDCMATCSISTFANGTFDTQTAEATANTGHAVDLAQGA